MTAFNEFELLEAAEDIEPGDYLAIEDQDSGEEHAMQLVKSTSSLVYVRDSSGNTHTFCPRTLEGKGDNSWIIIGKADV